MTRSQQLRRSLALAVACVLTACGLQRPDGWTETTHGKDTPPDYDRLFSTSVVHAIDIKIDPDDFAAMQADLAEVVGGGFGGGEPPDGGMLPPSNTCEGLALGDPCEVTVPAPGTGTCQSFDNMLVCVPEGGGGPGGPGGDPGGGGGFSLQDPIYVPVEVVHDGHTWWHVGMRYKGNSSLSSSQQSGQAKLPFRLNFDKYEDDFPEIEDQHFYGFKDLTFGSNWSDDSQIREVFAAELFRDRGVPAAKSAFYRVTIDVGEGPVYWGLYTAVEDPSDAMLDAQFGNDTGNLYKPEGTGADWTVFDPEGLPKKTNEDAADWSDVEAAIAALHADQTDASAWRDGLETSLDVDAFLRWLAVNTAMQNWDAYGQMAHNYYLYGDPDDSGRLRWIPWDHNLSMMSQGGFMMGGGGGPEVDAPTEILHRNVGASWPLISRVLADPAYAIRYRELLVESQGGLFEEGAASRRLRELHDLVAPHVVGEQGEVAGFTTISSAAAFLASIDGETGLIAHFAARRTRVADALAAP
jgi:spore coat protein H